MTLSPIEGSGVKSPVNHEDIGFRIAPRINAFTRMGGGGEIVDLFAFKERSEADKFVNKMNEMNSERRRTEDLILGKIDEKIEKDPTQFDSKFIVAYGEEWHRGVIGNVAARLVERFYRPSLVISQSNGRSQGSCRSIPGFHILDALEDSAEFFKTFGGHAQAAGCTLHPDFNNEEGLKLLSRKLSEYADKILPEDALTAPQLRVDADLAIEDITLRHCEDLARLAPNGIGNPEPIFCSSGVEISSGPWVLKDKHLKFITQSANVPNNVIWWRNGNAAEELKSGESVDIAYTLSRDDYMGVERLLFTVKDLNH